MTPQDIEAAIGIKPDEAWKKGDRRGAFGAIAPDHGYFIDSGASFTASFNDGIKALVTRVSPAAQKIGAIAANCKIEVNCNLQRKAVPLLTIGRDELRWFAVMGAALQLDTFVITDAATKAAAKPGETAEKPKQGF